MILKITTFSNVKKPVFGGSENGTETIFVFIDFIINFSSYLIKTIQV